MKRRARTSTLHVIEGPDFDRKVVELCRSREIVECLHYACWTFPSQTARLALINYEYKDADGDDITADRQPALLAGVAPVTIIIAPDASPADVVRLLRKVTDGIASGGLAEGVLTAQPKHPYLARHPEIERAISGGEGQVPPSGRRRS